MDGTSTAVPEPPTGARPTRSPSRRRARRHGPRAPHDPGWTMSDLALQLPPAHPAKFAGLLVESR
ncbi:hypothetical protein [Streptomyces sp. ISL-11]|uniref:hypothetical protein n=1 Tax=Streptomyces sp. ISL-11 TaxID=2819174 RepID=UPI001BEC944D|nr:hypothetical protein [Streptomyces sp. ISL-11]MBT2382517.1 hypothetical protein [Streptomyces sp. ISL-11]